MLTLCEQTTLVWLPVFQCLLLKYNVTFKAFHLSQPPYLAALIPIEWYLYHSSCPSLPGLFVLGDLFLKEVWTYELNLCHVAIFETRNILQKAENLSLPRQLKTILHLIHPVITAMLFYQEIGKYWRISVS